jgi:hypothetical protein
MNEITEVAAAQPSPGTRPLRARPLWILARLLLASIVVMGGLQIWRQSLIEPMIPLLRGAVEFVAPDFQVDVVDIAHRGLNDTLRFRANLAAPIFFAGHTIYPFGWGNRPRGGYQISLTLGGLLGYVALFLIIIIALPARGVRNHVFRLVLSPPLIAILLLIDAPFTVAAELWNALYQDYAPHEICALMVWSRFLMGGGGYVLAILFAGIAISAANRISVTGFAPNLRGEHDPDDARAWNLRHRR